MTKNEIKKLIETSPSSIFTKDDVLRLVENLEDNGFSEQFESLLINEFENNIENAGDLVDIDDAEFELNGCNTIILNDVPINYKRIVRELRNSIENVKENR